MERHEKTVFVLQGFSPEGLAAYRSIVRPSVQAAGAHTFRVDELAGAGSIIEAVYEAIEKADLLICDVSDQNPNVMYELGYAHALRKPVVLIAHAHERMPFDIRSVRIIYYDMSMEKERESMLELQRAVREAIQDPDAFSCRPTTSGSVNKVFISYSHRDAQYLTRLLVHLKPLEKRGLLDMWVDTKLAPGDKWREEVSKALSVARVAVLLVSADFLASDFIVENELPPLLRNAESQGVMIIPIIVRPCRFVRDKELSRYQAVPDPSTPLSSMSDNEQEAVFDRISALIEDTLLKV